MKERNFWIQKISHIYKTEPVGNINQDEFFNMCVLIDTRYPPKILLQKCQDIETLLGRVRSPEKWGPRIIDIDILLYEDLLVDEPDLQIPHPRMAERRFVLEPLNEIAPLFKHPILGKTVHRLLVECSDESRVLLFKKL